jgi:hypothetical protein
MFESDQALIISHRCHQIVVNLFCLLISWKIYATVNQRKEDTALPSFKRTLIDKSNNKFTVSKSKPDFKINDSITNSPLQITETRQDFLNGQRLSSLTKVQYY